MEGKDFGSGENHPPVCSLLLLFDAKKGRIITKVKMQKEATILMLMWALGQNIPLAFPHNVLRTWTFQNILLITFWVPTTFQFIGGGLIPTPWE